MQRNATVVRTPRRRTTWFNKFFETSHTAAPDQSVFDITHPAIAAGAEPTGTVVRMILEVHMANAATVADLTSLGLGILVTTLDAFTAGAVPDPLTDEGQDWYYWWAGKPALSAEGLLVVKQDIRSARKLRGGYRLILVAENTVNELTTEIAFMVRTLWMMP